MEILSKIVPITILAFVFSSMLSVGLSLTVCQILAPLRNYRLIVLALLANFVLIPFGLLASQSCSGWTNHSALLCSCWAQLRVRRFDRYWLESAKEIWRSPCA